MVSGRARTLRKAIETFVPRDASIDRITAAAIAAINTLERSRGQEIEQLLDLLAIPMQAGDPVRAATLRALADSPIERLRTGFAALKRLALFLAYADSSTDAENPLWRQIGYPGPRNDRTLDEPSFTLSIAREGERVCADIVVIGSGAGGGVLASAFARAGKRVVVLEAGGSLNVGSQREIATRDLYLEAGLCATDDLGVAVLAGATLGGGTTVNWCTSLRLSDPIAAEWEATTGIAGLAAELGDAYDALEGILDLAVAPNHNPANRAILDGCAALGLSAAEMPRNARDCGDGCGYCGFGCAYGKKRSTPKAFLPDVIRAGGAIYAGARAENLAFSGKRARSVSVTQIDSSGSRRFEVVADTYVVAGGALRTPGILSRSGITHPLLGRRLFLHPTTAVFGTFDRPIDPWNGPMQSAYTDAFNGRGETYGPKIETAPVHPGLSALSVPWRSRDQHARVMACGSRMATLIAVVRDRDPGSISLDDAAHIRYRLSAYDGGHIQAGIIGMIEILFAAGATRVSTLHNRPLTAERSEWNAGARRAFTHRLTRTGYAPNRQILFSAHQMGTATMGSDPAHSVVDPTGAVWGYENVLVADSSLFPLSSGANPMLTILAMAGRIAAHHGAPVHAEPGVAR